MTSTETPAQPLSNTHSSTYTDMECAAIIDCGAQYTKVIDRRIRELNIHTEIYPHTVSAEALRGKVSAIILSGGPHSVTEEGSPQIDPQLFELGVPVLGICYGMQLMTHLLGGTVSPAHQREYGETTISVDTDCVLFQGTPAHQTVLMSHGDSVTQLAPGFAVVGRSPAEHANPENEPQVVAAIANEDRRFYGVQFHPEVELSQYGQTVLKQFLLEVCQFKGRFTLENRLEQTLEEIRQQVGDNPVFVLVSGGVDSAVTAVLLVKALGPEQVYAVHIDSGMMRHQESDRVMDALKALGLTHLKCLQAEQDFLNGTTTTASGETIGPLCKTSDPEHKRQIIGDVFFHLIRKEMETVEQLAKANHQKVFLAQGTLRPDLIESGNRDVSATAHTIKTHHNDVALIRNYREQGLVVETNRDWHKDEVRQIGRMLGLPEDIVSRQPFPGPGLGIRVLCCDKPFGLEQYDEINTALQAFAQTRNVQAVLTPVRSVGVQGDGRSYSYLALLTCEGLDKPETWQHLRQCCREIPNRFPAINRLSVVLNKGTLPHAIKQVTPTFLTHPILEKLRDADRRVTQAFHQSGLQTTISQLLTVLLPLDTSASAASSAVRHSLGIRGVITSDFMTARAALPGQDIPIETLMTLVQELSDLPEVDLVTLDITSKPPATVEWE